MDALLLIVGAMLTATLMATLAVACGPDDRSHTPTPAPQIEHIQNGNRHVQF